MNYVRIMHVAVYITTRNAKEARKIGSILLHERLAACINIIPEIESIYWWNNKVEQHGESLLIAKTKKELVKKIIKVVKENSSYSVPCVNALQIVKGNPDYLKWIDQETRQNKK